MTTPKPTALKMVQGTYRRDRARAEPQPAVGAKPPPWLPTHGPARAAWRRLAPDLVATRVLTVADAEALALGCIALADYLAVRDDDAAGWRRADACWKRYLAVLVQFGMTPAARVRVAAVPVPPADPLAEWIATGPPPAEPSKPRRKRADPPAPSVDGVEAWLAGAKVDPA